VTLLSGIQDAREGSFQRIAVATEEASWGGSGKSFRRFYHLDMSNIQYYQKADISAMELSFLAKRYHAISIRYIRRTGFSGGAQ